MEFSEAFGVGSKLRYNQAMDKAQRKLAGQRVRLLRKDMGLGQEELGALIGVSNSTISGIETGFSGITRVADKLAQALGTTTDYLYGLSDNPLPVDDDTEPAAEGDPVRAAVLAEFERLDDVDRRALYQIAITLRLAREQREKYRVIE